MDEIWKPVVGYEGYYEVSDRGRVRSCTREVRSKSSSIRVITGKIITPFFDERGRSKVRLYKGGASKMQRVHRTVLAAFVGPCPPGMEGCHNNGDCGDDRLSNLRWDTREENERDKLAHGTGNQGSRHPLSVLTEQEIIQLRMAVGAGISRKSAAAMYGITISQVGRIVTRTAWRHVP